VAGDIGDVSDGQNDTPNRNMKKNDNDLLKYLQESVHSCSIAINWRNCRV
jgi:hypothetical protein